MMAEVADGRGLKQQLRAQLSSCRQEAERNPKAYPQSSSRATPALPKQPPTRNQVFKLFGDSFKPPHSRLCPDSSVVNFFLQESF